MDTPIDLEDEIPDNYRSDTPSLEGDIDPDE